MLPYTFPHIITGLRLSIGVAWMVIVAGEMLSGGIGLAILFGKKDLMVEA